MNENVFILVLQIVLFPETSKKPFCWLEFLVKNGLKELNDEIV